MIIHYLSASRLKKYLQCPEAYHQHYENGVKSDAEHLRFGTLMHKVLERWYQEFDKTMKEIFDYEWIRADIASPELHKDALDIIDIFERQNNRNESINLGFELAFAIDILNDRVVDTSHVDWSDYDQMKAFLKTLEEDENPYIFGYIDRVEYDAISDTLKIKDYKTSRIPLTQAEADTDEQMSMYALVAEYMFPEYERVALQLEYVRHGTTVTTYRSAEDNARFKDWLILMFYKIKEDTAHVATLNKYCGWCDARHGCYAYKQLLDEGYDVDAEKLDFEAMDVELEKLKVYKKIMEGRIKEIETTMKDQLKATDNRPIVAGSAERYLTPNMRVNYDPATVLNIFGEDGFKFLSVNKTEVDKAVRGDEEKQRALMETGHSYYIAPTLRRGKGKK